MTAVDPATLERQITDLLNSLGNHFDKVADNLRARQIKGVPKSECDCPLARLIRALPGVADVEVGNGKAIVYPAGEDGVLEIWLPEAVSDFTWVFDLDRGPFLDLIDDGAVA